MDVILSCNDVRHGKNSTRGWKCESPAASEYIKILPLEFSRSDRFLKYKQKQRCCTNNYQKTKLNWYDKDDPIEESLMNIL